MLRKLFCKHESEFTQGTQKYLRKRNKSPYTFIRVSICRKCGKVIVVNYEWEDYNELFKAKTNKCI